MFTNRNLKELREFFDTYAEDDFARSGFETPVAVTLDAGLLDFFPHTMLEPLRKLGLPVVLERGVIRLTEDYNVCSEGDVLTPEQTQILVRAAD